MYSTTTLAKKYFNWYRLASNGKGHGIHSPFVYDFVRTVLLSKEKPEIFGKIELLRKKLLKDETVIPVVDFGAGSSVIKSNKRVVKKIAASSLKQKKYAQLLHNVVAKYQPENVLELGTSFGITTLYIATANPNMPVYTLEGSPEIAKRAQENFQQLQLENILLVEGGFSKNFLPVLNKMGNVGFAFIDGNHQQKPTEYYFEELMKHRSEKSIFIFDDIHWSAGMEAAWDNIKGDPSVTLSLDLFFIGIVFFDASFKEKQHFSLRF